MSFSKYRVWINVTIFIILIFSVGMLFGSSISTKDDAEKVPESRFQEEKSDTIQQRRSTTSNEPLEIYMVKENTDENRGLNDLILEDEPLIGRDQLKAYYWDQHILKVKDGKYLERIRKYIPVSGNPFVLVSKGKRLYKGYFWTYLSSLSYPATPVIHIEGVMNEDELYISRERDEILLQLILPSDIQDQQLLNSTVLFEALKESDKLVESSSAPEEAGEVYSIDTSKTEKVTIELEDNSIHTIKGSTELKNFSGYLRNLTLLPNDNKIRVNRASIVKFKLWNKDGTTASYNTVYDNLYDMGYIEINGLKVSADLDFFRLLESYSRYGRFSYDVPDDVRNLFHQFGWTVSFKVNEMREKLPNDLKYQAGEFPIKIYWAYNFTLSSAVGLSSLEEYLGNIVEVEIYRLNEGLPEEYAPNIEARGVIIRSQGEIIGAYMDRGRHSSFACSLDRKNLEQITGKSWSEWIVEYIDFDYQLLKELSTLTPQELIKTCFDALDKGDYKRYYATFSLQNLVSSLSANMDFTDLYNKEFSGTNVHKARLLKIGDSIEENEYKTYPVEVDFGFKEVITSDNGPQTRFVRVVKESESIGWRIDGIGTGP